MEMSDRVQLGLGKYETVLNALRTSVIEIDNWCLTKMTHEYSIVNTVLMNNMKIAFEQLFFLGLTLSYLWSLNRDRIIYCCVFLNIIYS